MSDRPRRILIVIAQLRRGGAERQVHELILRIDRERFLPMVVTFEPGGHYEPLIRASGVEVAVIEKRGWREPGALLKLGALMRRFRPDVVHSFLLPASWRSLLAGRFAGKPPVIAGVRSVRFWENARLRMMEAATLARARLVIGNAPAVREHLLRQYPLEPGRVRVIMNGVDTDAFRPGPSALRGDWLDGSRSADRIVGFVGSFRSAKDPLLFVAIAGLLARRFEGLRFVMVGDGPLRPEVLARARALGIADRIILAGERSDMPDVMRAIDLLAVTSEREGCCNAILEALASGVPVVATRVGGNPDLLPEAERLFPHGDAEAGAKAAAALLADEAGRAKAGVVARERAVSLFSVGAMVQETERVYGDVS